MPAWLLTLPWKKIGYALLAIGIASFIWHRGYHSRDAEVAALNQTIANMKAASAQAAADNLAHVRAVEAKNAAIQKDMEDALETQLADARAAAGAFVVRQRAQAATDNAGAGRVSDPPDATGSIDDAGGKTLVPDDDLRICAENTVKAQGWADWWKAIGIGAR